MQYIKTSLMTCFYFVLGVLVWKQKIGDDNLRLRYYESILEEEYTFQWKLK